MIESEMMNQMESLTKLPTSPISMPEKAASSEADEFFDLTDLKQALLNQSGAEVRRVHQQKMVAAQRQIAENTCKNGVPPKQLLLYLVR